MENINIGDNVRFLNYVGGGKVTGFQKGGIVLVEDQDGFEQPVLMSEVVVVEPSGEKPKQKAVQEQKPAKAVSQPSAAAQPSAVPQPRAASQAPAAKDIYPAEPANEDLETRVIRLEMTVKRLLMRIERLEAAKTIRENVKQRQIAERQQHSRQGDILEIDLHIESLLDTTAGMSPKDIKDYQLEIFRKTMSEHRHEKGRKIVFIHGNGDGVLRKSIISELQHCYKSCHYQDASFQQYAFGATMVTIH